MENAAFSSTDLVEFMNSMKAMKMSVESMGKDLGKEIRDSKDEIKGEIQRIHQKIDREVKIVKEGTENLRKDLSEVRKENIEQMERMEERIEKMEAGADNLETQKRKRSEITENTDARVQPVGRTYKEILKQTKDTAPKTVEPFRLQPGGSGLQNTGKGSPAVEEIPTVEYKSTWARQMSQISLETQLKIATDAACRLEEGNDEDET